MVVQDPVQTRNEFSLRDATIDDIPAIQELINPHLFKYENGVASGEMKFRPNETYLELISKGATKVAILNGEIVGVASVVKAEDGYELAGWKTKNGFEGIGIGTELVKDRMEYTRNLGAAYLLSKTQPHNRAKLLKMGFIPEPFAINGDCDGCPIMRNCNENGYYRDLGLDELVTKYNGSPIAIVADNLSDPHSIITEANSLKYLGIDVHFIGKTGQGKGFLGQTYDIHEVKSAQETKHNEIIYNLMKVQPDHIAISQHIADISPKEVFYASMPGTLLGGIPENEITSDQAIQYAQGHLAWRGYDSLISAASAGVPARIFDPRKNHSMYEALKGNVGLLVKPQ